MAEAETTKQFMAALAALEQERDLEQISQLFAAKSEVRNVVSPRTFTGPDGAREFWQVYRDTFGDVDSTFRNAIVGDGRAALEWTTTGTAANGAPIEYEGVSILEMKGGQITRFCAYFDPGALGRQIEPGTGAS